VGSYVLYLHAQKVRRFMHIHADDESHALAEWWWHGESVVKLVARESIGQGLAIGELCDVRDLLQLREQCHSVRDGELCWIHELCKGGEVDVREFGIRLQE